MASIPTRPQRPLNKSDIGSPAGLKLVARNVHLLLETVARKEPHSGAAPTTHVKRKAPPPPTTPACPTLTYVRPAPPPPSTKPPVTSYTDESPDEETYEFENGRKMQSSHRLLTALSLPSVLPSEFRTFHENTKTKDNIDVSQNENMGNGQAMATPEASKLELNQDPYRNDYVKPTNLSNGGLNKFLLEEKFNYEEIDTKQDVDTSPVYEGVVLRKKNSSASIDHHEMRGIHDKVASIDDVFHDTDHVGYRTTSRGPYEARDSTYEAFAALDEAISGHSCVGNIYEDIEFLDTPDERVVQVGFLSVASEEVPQPPDAMSLQSDVKPTPAPRRLVTKPMTALDVSVTVPRPVTRKMAPLSKRELVTSKTADNPGTEAQTNITSSSSNKCVDVTDRLNVEEQQVTSSGSETTTDNKLVTTSLCNIQREKQNMERHNFDAATEQSTVPPDNNATRSLNGGENGISVGGNDSGKLNWDPNRCFTMDDVEDPQMKLLFENAGVTNEELQDADTRAFIYRFLLDHGGMDAVKREAHFKATLQRKPRTQTPGDYVPRRHHYTHL